MLDPFEDVVVFYKGFYWGNRKDSGVLAIARFRLVVLNDMIGDKGHTLIRKIQFPHINRIGKSGIVPIKITFHSLDILHMETENIVVKDGVFD